MAEVGGDARKTGGIIYASPRKDNAIYELVEPYFGEDGYIKEQGFKVVETKSHGKFAVYLVELPLRDDWVTEEQENEIAENIYDWWISVCREISTAKTGF